VILPVSYSFRNLWNRRLTSVLTITGMALVVFVFAAILMLAEGVQKTLVETGSYDNVVIVRRGSSTEVDSTIDRLQASVVETQSVVALGGKGRPMAAKEVMVLISLPKRGDGKRSNVIIRGIGAQSMPLRPQVKLIEGRLPRPGSSEIIAGQRVAQKFRGGGLGESLRFGMRDWSVVGIFDAGNTAFSSEIWGDADQLMQAFRRTMYSSVLIKLRDAAAFETFRTAIESDPRLTLEAKRENRYYADQSEIMAKFLRILGISLTVIFSMGAVIGAMITMYASVATRTREIGTLRALGFGRKSILTAFLIESLLLGFLGGCIGLFMASFLQLFTFSTMNFQTFAELAFDFALSFEIVYKALVFSLVMGLVGGVLPAARAARMNIVTALHSG